MLFVRVYLRSFAAIFLILATLEFSTAAETVQFTNRPPQAGQHGSRDMQFVLDLDVSLHQAGQTISSEHQSLSREQERQVRIVQVDHGLVTKAEVTYSQARQTVGRGKQEGAPQSQPIEGKTYVVERSGEELIVTDPAGKPVLDPERALVAASMEALGKPNPLGVFLNGKNITVGQKLELPNEMAADLLGMKNPGGEPQKVELILRGVHADQDRRLADFDMALSLKIDGGSTMQITGTLQLEPETCQIASATFAGPVSMHSEEGPKGHTFEVHQDGTMKIAMRAKSLR
jgi:hypothetical protein